MLQIQSLIAICGLIGFVNFISLGLLEETQKVGGGNRNIYGSKTSKVNFI